MRTGEGASLRSLAEEGEQLGNLGRYDGGGVGMVIPPLQLETRVARARGLRGRFETGNGLVNTDEQRGG